MTPDPPLFPSLISPILYPPPSVQNGFPAFFLLSPILLHTCTSDTGCSYMLNKKDYIVHNRTAWVPPRSTMHSQKRIGWIFPFLFLKTFLAKSCKFGVLFYIRPPIQLSPCSVGSEREILHTSAVDLDARVEDTNPQGGGIFIYPVLQ